MKPSFRLISMTTVLLLAYAVFVVSCLAVSESFLVAQDNSGKEESKQSASNAGPSADEMERIGKMVANPVGEAWLFWTQNDYSEVRGDLVPGGKRVNSLKFQTIMSFPIDLAGDDWNLIIRPVFQFQSVPLDKDVKELFGFSETDIIADPDLSRIAQHAWDDRTNGFGDTGLLTLLGPNRLDGFIWGAGISQIFPTAQEDVLGQGKCQAGPAVLLARLAPNVGGFNLGALGQHWWSYAGDRDREDVSQTDIQYFINYRLTTTALVGMTPNIRINWEADDNDDKLTLPREFGHFECI